MTDESKIEAFPVDKVAAIEEVVSTEAPKVPAKAKRDIIRFNGEKQTAINLEHVTTISLEDKTIHFDLYSRVQSIDFLDEQSAAVVFEGVLQLWTAEME